MNTDGVRVNATRTFRGGLADAQMLEDRFVLNKEDLKKIVEVRKADNKWEAIALAKIGLTLEEKK